MKKLFLMAAIALSAVCCSADPTAPLPRKDASKMGIDTTGFSQVHSDVMALDGPYELHSMMVLKDGKVIYEHWWEGHTPDEKHVMNSVSKTFTSAAFGFAVQEGLISVDDKVLDYFNEDEIPSEPSENLKNLTIKNLMTMSSGFAPDMLKLLRDGEPDELAKAILSSGYDFVPGTMWRYTNSNTYLISAILTRVTGQKVEDYLKPRLFDPLGISDYEWTESKEGYNYGAFGLYITTESMARMGQFYLQKGKWNGKQLLSADWIEASMSPQILESAGKEVSEEDLEKFKNDDWQQGYGYQMWVCTHGAARMDGANCQEVFVCPEKNAVVVLTGNCNRYKYVFNSMWKNVYDKL